MKKIHYLILSLLCSIIFCTVLNAQDSLNKAGYDKAPPPNSQSSPSNYGKAPPMANPKQLNRTTAGKDLNTQVQQKATNQYGPPPVSGKAASNPYGTLPKKPANEPDNKIGGTIQDGYDDVPPPPNSQSSPGNYGKAPPMANPKQLNKTTASKDLNTQVQQKATNQYGPPPVSGSAAAQNPKSQYGPLPPAGRTQQYGTVPPKNTQGQVVNQNNTVKPPVAAGVRTQQYGTVPVQPKATSSTPPQKAPPPPPTTKKGSK